MNRDEPPPIKPSASGLQIPWRSVAQAIFWLVPIIATGAMVYLSSVFATQSHLEAAVRPYETLPGRVDRLEEFKRDHRVEQAAAAAAVGALQQDMAGIKAELRALSKESEKNTDRILQRLDAIQSSR